MTAGIVAACLTLATLMGNPLPFFLLVPVTAIWAALDASNIRRRCLSDTSAEQDKDTVAGLQTTKPVIVFAACLLFWIFGFPWYLTVRSKLLNKVAPPKEEVEDATG